MRYTTLGRTGLRVSVAGLGCGGFSRLGLGTGQSAERATGIMVCTPRLGRFTGHESDDDLLQPYRTSVGTTLILLNGEPLINLVLTTV